jgi:hypothetical protein
MGCSFEYIIKPLESHVNTQKLKETLSEKLCAIIKDKVFNITNVYYYKCDKSNDWILEIRINLENGGRYSYEYEIFDKPLLQSLVEMEIVIIV